MANLLRRVQAGKASRPDSGIEAAEQGREEPLYVPKSIDRGQLFAIMKEVMSTIGNEGTAEPVAFDRHELLDRVAGDEVLLVELVKLFQQSLSELLEEIDAAIEQSDGARLQRTAHTLKGALLNLAAHPSAALARELEERGCRNEMSAAGEALRRLRGELSRLDRALGRATGGTTA
jgi:HPt (histidine-containing phosphotransfer) domain-containing protein